jgi:K+-H+ exchange-related protein
MMLSLDLYLVKGNSNRYVLFSSPEALHYVEDQSGDYVQQFLQWFMHRRLRIAAWMGRVMNAGHEYYLKLEDKIDPQERVLKAMASVEHLTVYHSSTADAQIRSKFEGLLKRQRMKHTFWFVVDVVITPFTLLLVPIPGPNVVLYYPLLRLLSHYRAMTGATKGLRSRHLEFKSLPDLSGLEDNLPGFSTFIRRVR